jgi:hypothetical protein
MQKILVQHFCPKNLGKPKIAREFTLILTHEAPKIDFYNRKTNIIPAVLHFSATFSRTKIKEANPLASLLFAFMTSLSFAFLTDFFSALNQLHSSYH